MSSPSTLLLPTYKQTLRSLSAWLDKAGDDELLARRLAPDMFGLFSQVCFVCFQSQEAIYRLQNLEVPASLLELALEGRAQDLPADALTIPNAKAKIEAALAFLEDLDPDVIKRLDDEEGGKITLELPGPMVFENMTHAEYIRDWALPQYYFHLVTAYSILRNAGVGLGKADYVPHMFAYLRQTPKEE